MVRILSILPVVGHPRDSKRISMLQQLGFSLEAVAFERNKHRGRLPSCSINILGKLNDGRYLKRCLKLIAVIPVLRGAIKRSHLVWASGVDMASMAIIAGIGLNKPVIVEVGDIRKIQVISGLRGWIVRKLDRSVVKACSLLVATAPGFVDEYYRNWLHIKTRAMILENKLEAKIIEGTNLQAPQPVPGKPLIDRPLRIGYFGVLRCDWSWRALKALARTLLGKIEIVIAGIPMVQYDLNTDCKKSANIEYKGTYRSPQDLPSLYESVDLVWACYPSPEEQSLKWCWAQKICRSNRFYESCYFQKPLISMKGSGDAAEVERYGIGMTLDRSDIIEKVVNKISGLTSANLTLWQKNLSTLPRNVYQYTSEADELKHILKEVVGNHFRQKT